MTRTAKKFFIVTMLSICLLCVRGVLAAPQRETLTTFFERTITDNQSKPADTKILDEVERRTSAASDGEISDALPVIIAAAQSDDDMTARCAGIALTGIAYRSNSAVLLTPYASDIGTLFDSSKDYMRRGSLLILATLKPTTPPEAVAVLLDFVKRTSADEKFQVATLGGLLQQKPYNETVISAAVQFLGRTLDTNNRLIVLNGIEHSAVKDVRIERVVISELSDVNPRIQLAAIAVLNQMGIDALAKALPALAELADSRDKDVAAAARQALARVRSASQ